MERLLPGDFAAAAVLFIGIMVGFWLITKLPSKLALFGIAICMFTAGFFIEPGNSHELLIAVAVFRLTGGVGMVLGLFDFIKKWYRRPLYESPESSTTLAQPTVQSLKCPQCHLINVLSASHCRRCGVQLILNR